MVMIDQGNKLRFPLAQPGESVDILSFVVTKAGWETLTDLIGISPSNPVRILTRLIYQSASELIEQAGRNWDWHHLPHNHAKVILYRKRKVAVLGSFNVTQPSLGKNVECLAQVDGATYNRLADMFEAYWTTSERDESAIVTRQTIAQEVADTFDDSKEETTGQDAATRDPELTDGPRTPWTFQESIIQQVMTWLDTAREVGLGNIVTLPTGAGKTLVAAEVIRRLRERKPQARILWVCHRVELLRQSWSSTRRQLNGSTPDER